MSIMTLLNLNHCMFVTLLCFISCDSYLRFINGCFFKPQISSGLGSPGPAFTRNPERDGEHASGPRHAHHHQVRAAFEAWACELGGVAPVLHTLVFVQKQGDQPRWVYLLLQEINEASDRTRPLLPAPQGEVTQWRLLPPEVNSLSSLPVK